MAIDLLNVAAPDAMAPDGRFLAKLLLQQAGIPPCDCQTFPCGCQYRIDAFDVNVFRIRIVDHGREHFLTVAERQSDPTPPF